MILILIQIYQNIEIVDTEKYQAEKEQYTESIQTVENENQKSEKISDMIEKTTQSVVGISKLKNAGNTLLTKATEEELGLGSGIIVTENGYILSNEHVTGSKYSKCYITLEDRAKPRRNSSMERHRPRPITNKNKWRKFAIYNTGELKQSQNRRDSICNRKSNRL